MYTCLAVCLLIHTKVVLFLFQDFLWRCAWLNWWEISGKEQRLSGSAWKVVEELALWFCKTQGDRCHRQTSSMQSITIPPTEPAHDHREIEDMYSKAQTHFFFYTVTYFQSCLGISPSPSQKNMASQMGFAITKFKLATSNPHTVICRLYCSKDTSWYAPALDWMHCLLGEQANRRFYLMFANNNIINNLKKQIQTTLAGMTTKYTFERNLH